MHRLLTIAALALMLPPLAARADDVALVLGIERYAALDRLPRGTEVVEAAETLAAQGFRVFAQSGGTAAETAETLADFLAAAPDASRIVIVLSGHFITDGRLTWLLTADATAPELPMLGDRAVSVDALLSVLAHAQGGALLLLATDPSDRTATGPWVRFGLPSIDPPQGVTLLSGSPRDVADFIADTLAAPGTDLSAALSGSDRILATGFLPDPFVFLPAAAGTATANPAPGAEEEALWSGVLALDTDEAYRNYLDAYPRGRFAAEARAAIAAHLAEPDRIARLAEDALALSRDDIRAIQRDLTLLGFATRGIDGIPGPATRAAVTAWQQQEGFPQTGYLTGEQITRLDAQAARRSAQIEAEAAIAAEIAAAADRAFWDETGARGDEAGLAAYLERYPDGIFATTASAELDRMAQARRLADRAAWDSARLADTAEAYDAYLREYPAGLFRQEAQDRLRDLADAAEIADRLASARSTEEALNLDTDALRRAEARLAELGLNPGAVDGRIELASRRAVRAFQRDSGLPPTGFLDRATLDRLFAGLPPAP
jgi:peptidoglycan hydrolase-like protein with peptidoglycan-binding domain